MTVRRGLLLASAHMLFLELALIRWTGANVVHLSYFANFVLLGSFLGIGLGFLLERRWQGLPYFAPVALGLLVALVYTFPVSVSRSSSEIIYFSSTVDGAPPWLVLPAIFVVVATVLTGSGALVARYFRRLPALEAYRLDLIGSLVGIGSFTLLSWVGTPPVAWGLLVVLGYLLLLVPPRPPLLVAAALAATAGVLALQSAQPELTWTPYSTLRTWTTADGAVAVNANGVPHQVMSAPAERLAKEPFYASPYDRVGSPHYERALIIGAGTGSDVAIALDRGVAHVDAVEIDPGILELGREQHPSRPYDDPRVRTHVDDGRAFLQRAASGSYDLVIFALPDSLTVVTGSNSLRLESYLFTEESFEQARRVLTDDGVFAMYNYYRQGWLLDRLAGTATDVFGTPPCVDALVAVSTAAALVTSPDATRLDCATTWQPAGDVVAPAQDDRPFLYLREPGIPTLYLAALSIIVLVSVAAVRVVGGPLRQLRPYTDLFLLGAAFLLLETRSVTTFALLFGTTWMVNAIVFAGILVAVLASVEVTRRFRTPPLVVMYVLLAGALLLAWAVPNAWLLSLPTAVRLGAAVTLAFLPVFTANVIFAKRLDTVPEPTAAFGANLLGAMLGGCLEYVALLTGYRALLLLALLLYAGAAAALARTNRAALLPA